MYNNNIYLANEPHDPFCKCYDCTGLAEHKILGQRVEHADYPYKVGDYIQALKPITIVNGKTTRTGKVNSIGKIDGMYGKWITFKNGDIVDNIPANFKVIQNPAITSAVDVLINSNPLSWTVAESQSIIQGKPVSASEAVRTSATEVQEGATALANVDWIGDLKWIAIGIVVVLVLILAIKLS